MENINNTNGNAESAEIHLDKGNALSDQGDHESAISAYDKALDLNPNLAVAYYNRGIAKGQIEQYREAISDYDAAIRLNPDDADAYNNRGIAKRKIEQYPEAFPIMTRQSAWILMMQTPTTIEVLCRTRSDNTLRLFPTMMRRSAWIQTT